MPIPVIELMSRQPVTIPFDTSASTAEAYARQQGVHHLIVVDEDALVGVVCLCNLANAGPNDSVERCMRIPAFVSSTADAEEAVATMRACGIGCLPVLDGSGRLLGVVTRRDLRGAGFGDVGLSGAVRCASCGVICHGTGSPGPVVFCAGCLDQVARSGPDDPYFTLGGGG